MKLSAGRFVSAILVAGAWLLTGARAVLDLVGYSTAPEDFGVAGTRLAWLVAHLVDVPWWAFFVFALIVTMWLMWVSWPRAVLARDISDHDDPQIAAHAAGAPPSWLEVIADEDENEMGNRVWQPERQQARAVLNATDPFIAIELSFMNGSVFTLCDPIPSGLIKYKHDGEWHNLALSARLVQKDHNIPHGQVRIVAIDQLISRDMAADLKDLDANGELPLFTLESFGLVFSYRNRHGKWNSVRIGGGNLPLDVKF